MNKLFLIFLVALLVLATGCSRKSRYYYSKKPMSKPRTYSSSTDAYNSGISQKEYRYAKMNPYVVYGIKYYPEMVDPGDVFHGVASWYGPDFHAKLTANGETYNMYDMTAAHKTLPMNTVLKVTNKRNGRTAIVRINDRGPFVGTRIIDLSNAAARKINMIGAGTAPVSIEVLGFYSKNKKRITRKKVVQKPKKAIISKEKASYSLQIGSFSNIDGAIKIQEKYNNTDGYTTVIKDIETDNGRFFKVYLNGFTSEKEIRNYKENSEFSNSFIIKN